MGHALGNNYGKFYSMLSKPVLVDCSFVVDPANTNGLGVSSVKGQAVQNVFMHTSATPGKGPNGLLNPNPANGFAWIQLAYNYTKYYGGFGANCLTTSGSDIAINSTALTIGNPYIISNIGHAAPGQVTIAPVADVSGSLASKYFRLYDSYGNTFVIWFSVSGVGSAPVGVGGTLVQQSIATNATAAQIGAALVTTIANLPSGVAGVFSFTASGTTTVTAITTSVKPYQIPGAPADGVSPLATGFTFAQTVADINHQDWYAVGVPQGVPLAVGVSFIAKRTGSGSSTGLVKIPSAPTINSVDVVGDASLDFGPQPYMGSPNVGAWILVQFSGATSSSVTTLIPAAPVTGTLVKMVFYVEQGSLIGGNKE